MLTMQDIAAIEESYDLEHYQALQRAINDGQAWKFQGSYGRAMMDAIQSGACMLGEVGSYDYYGNYIPNRNEVQAGTPGSYDYVAEAMGNDWASLMEEQQ